MRLTTLCLLAISTLTVLSKSIEPTIQPGQYTCQLIDSNDALTKRANSSKLAKCDEYNGCGLVDCTIGPMPQCQCVNRCNCCLRMYDYDHDYCAYKKYC